MVLDTHNEANVAARVGKDLRENRYSAHQLLQLGFRKVSVDEIGASVTRGPETMIGRVIEIASEGRHLARERGLMTVSKDAVEDGRVPLDDIGVLLCNARGLTYSNDLMAELARRARPSCYAETTICQRLGFGPWKATMSKPCGCVASWRRRCRSASGCGKPW